MYDSGVNQLWPAFGLLPILVSGPMKAAGIAAVGPVDLTVAAVVIATITSIIALPKTKHYPYHEVMPFVLFALVVLVSTTASSVGTYQDVKFRDFFFITTPVVLLAPILIGTRERMRGYLLVWGISGLIMVLLIATTDSSASLYGRVGIQGATLGPAYLLAIAVAAFVALMGEKRLYPWLGIPAVMVMTISLVSIGSRGPFLAALAGVFVWFVLRGLSVRAIAVIFVLGASTLLAFNFAPEASALRILRFESESRVSQLPIVQEAYRSNPFFGIGWGNYADLSSLSYPHNLFTETLAELGIIGILSLAWILARCVGNLWRYREFPIVRALGAVAVASFVGQQFSLSLTNRVFWLAIVGCLALRYVCEGSGSGHAAVEFDANETKTHNRQHTGKSYSIGHP